MPTAGTRQHGCSSRSPARGLSHASRTVEARRDPPVLLDEGDAPVATRELEKPLHCLGVALDVEVLYLHSSLAEVLTGGAGVGSGILSVNPDRSRDHAASCRPS